MMIVFEGHDGVGKTTLISHLKVLLSSNANVATLKTPNESFSDLRRSLENDTLGNLMTSIRFYTMANLYTAVIAQDLLYKYDIVLIDRYIYSTIVSFEARGYEIPVSLLSLFPSPTIVFWITAREEVRRMRLFSRVNNIHDIQSMDDKLIQRANQLYRDFNMVEVDNSGPIEIALDIIYHKILQISHKL